MPSADVSSDAELVKAVLGGDVASFEGLVVRYQPRLFAMARRYSRSESDTQDLVQDCFCKAFQKLASYRSDAPFEHWLMRVATHTCYDFLRSRQRNREDTLADLTEEQAGWLDRQQPIKGVDKDQVEAARALLEKALSRLAPEQRLVLTLLELEDRSVREVAELTGWNATLVKVRAFRARGALKQVLARMNVHKYL